MSRSVDLTKRAVKDLDALERSRPTVAAKVIAKIQSLADDPSAGKPLVGPLKGIWSMRIGEYRVLYEMDSKTVTILTVNHRKEAYR